jgi:hypothetical protein
MKIYDLDLKPIERVETNSPEEIARLMETERRPLIFSGAKEDLAFLNGWDMDFLHKLDGKVRVQKPEADGVNYFINYVPMPMSEVVDRIRQGDSLYIGAKKITGPKGIRSDVDGLGELADEMKMPKWIDVSRIHNANFWLGAGNNNTLLHYDAWDSVLLLGMGEKEFVVFPDTESPRMYQYSAFNFKALVEGRVLHSKIRPLSVQKAYQEKLRKAKGFRGTVKPGDVMFVPAGFWHFVESTGTNVAINFFIHTKNRRLHFREPLRTFWIKDNITLWPVRWYWKLKDRAARTYRHFFPKPVTN